MTQSTPHILLVDDDVQVVRYMKKVLEGNGYSVTGATSGKHAYSLIQDRLPDLLILDLNMPVPDGFDLLKIERSRFPHLKILVISGYLHGALLKAAKVMGASAILAKPVTPEALTEKIRDVLGGREAL